MSAFERLVIVATGPGDVMARARRIIGEERLALAISKLAFGGDDAYRFSKGCRHGAGDRPLDGTQAPRCDRDKKS